MKLPTKEQVLDASVEKVKKKKWVEIPANELVYTSRSNSRGCYFTIEDIDDNEIAYMDCHTKMESPYLNIRIFINDTTRWKIEPAGGEDDYCNYKIYKKA